MPFANQVLSWARAIVIDEGCDTIAVGWGEMHTNLIILSSRPIEKLGNNKVTIKMDFNAQINKNTLQEN